ncbi:MAG TPA: DUF1631 domain-containing protein, partial [Pseudomonas sp.]|nr:DUF1631 domain-containing protein [Pseudomonas sp.]
LDSGLPDAVDSLPGDDPDLLKARQLQVGRWFEFQESEALTVRCKLMAIVAPANTYVFVSRMGLKVLEKSAGQLAMALKAGTLRSLDEGLLFERALACVIDNLRQLNRGK